MRAFKYIMLIQCFLFFGCIGTEKSAWTVMDTWYNAPKENALEPWDWKENIFYEVKPESQIEAQLLLDEKQIIRITHNQANVLRGKKIKKDSNYDFYLIRGVFLNEGTGRFSVYSKGNSQGRVAFVSLFEIGEFIIFMEVSGSPG